MMILGAMAAANMQPPASMPLFLILHLAIVRTHNHDASMIEDEELPPMSTLCTGHQRLLYLITEPNLTKLLAIETWVTQRAFERRMPRGARLLLPAIPSAFPQQSFAHFMSCSSALKFFLPSSGGAKIPAAHHPPGQAGLTNNGETSRDGPSSAGIAFSSLDGSEKSSVGRPPSYCEPTFRLDVIETIERSFEELNDDLRDLSLKIHGASDPSYVFTAQCYPDN